MLWKGAPGEITEHDLTVMALGLPGEVGEVMEVIQAAPTAGLDLAEACKEMGDVVYYWARLVTAFDLDLASLVRLAARHPHPDVQGVDALVEVPSGLPSLPGIQAAALALGARQAPVVEQLKKRVRDGRFDPAAFAPAMAAFLAAWLELAQALQLRPSAILAANRKKVEARYGLARASVQSIAAG